MLTSLTRRHLIILLLITGLGLLLRVGNLHYADPKAPAVRGDAFMYFTTALNLKTIGVFSKDGIAVYTGKRGKPDATLPPAYPLFIKTFLTQEWRIQSNGGVDASVERAILAQTLLSTLLVPLVFFTGLGLLGPRLSLAAAGLAAIEPHLVNINIYLLTEPLFTVLLWLALCLLAQALARNARVAWALAAGLALAAATLTRPTIQYLPFVLAALLILHNPGQWRRWTAFLAVFVTVMGAWGIRNVVATGAFSDPTAMAATIQHGSYPGFMFAGDPDTLGMPYRYDAEMHHTMPLRDILSVIWQRALAAPGEYLHWYLVGKPLAFFGWEMTPFGTTDTRLLTSGDIYIYAVVASPYANQPVFMATYLVAYLLHWPLLVLAAIASVLAWLPLGRRLFGQALLPARVLALAWLYAIGIHMIGAPFPRYSIPFLPLGWLLAGGLLAAAWRLRQEARAVQAASAAG